VYQRSESSGGIDEISPLFQSALDRNLPANEAVHYLIFSPEFTSATTRHLASVFCVTDRRWLIALAESHGAVTAQTATFDETLLVELTIILLHGKVKIDFTQRGETRSAVLYFNTVMKSLYYAAVCEMLRAIDCERSKEKDQESSLRFPDWPQKFQNLAIIYTPPGCRLIDGVHSDTIYGRFFGEKAAATALLLTKENLIVIAEEKSRRWFPSRREAKYGGTMSYIPRRRIVKWKIAENPRVDLHVIELSMGKGVENLEIPLSSAKRNEARRIINQVTSDRSTA
jgi:hypothetical protein